MNFIQDNTLQDDPSIIISDITTQGNYALSVDGSLNAESLNINDVDVNISSYVKTKKDADDTNPYRILELNVFQLVLFLIIQ